MKNINLFNRSLVMIFVIVLAAATQIKAGLLYPNAVSAATSGGTANNRSADFAATPDGRFIVFESLATNLVSGLTDINGASDIFLYDANNNSIRCLSLSFTAAQKAGNAGSFAPVISPDGRWVLFSSAANDLVTTDSNNANDVFRFDTQTDQLVMVSVRADGTDGANGSSGIATNTYKPYDISDDGRFVAFNSLATNVTNLPDDNGGTDIFVRDMQSGTNRLISAHYTGTRATDNTTGNPLILSADVDISGDGKFLSFQSASGLMISGFGDANNTYDVYLKNLQTDSLRCLSQSNQQINKAGDDASFSPVMSRDGKRIAYVSIASDLAFPRFPGNRTRDVYVFDTVLNANILVSVNSAGTNGGNAGSETLSAAQLSITPDGRYVVFQSDATNLDANVTTGSSETNVYRRDLTNGTTQTVSVSAAGTTSGGVSTHNKKASSISDDGRFVTFMSESATLLAENFADDNFVHTFVRDMQTGITFTPSQNLGGTAFGDSSDASGAITGNGRWVIFPSSASNLTSGDANADNDIFRARINVPKTAVSDFDGDGLSDFVVFRPNTGTWYFLNNPASFASYRYYGTGTDLIAPADYNGDGRVDYAVFRPSNGTWYVSDSLTFNEMIVPFGQTGDKPLPEDFDGDNKADFAVYRGGTWWWKSSLSGQVSNYQFGVASDIPVQGDFDGDNKADYAVFRPSNGTWYVRRSLDGGYFSVNFGLAGDKPVAADYDGDGRTDIAVFRGGVWYILRSANNSVSIVQFGLANDLPSPASFDADGRADIAVFRPSDGNWYVLRSSNNTFAAAHFGQNGDLPAPAAFIP